MTRFLGFAIALLLIALFALPVRAEVDPYPEQMVEGFVTPLGYTFRQGYWWRGNVAYTRQQVWFTAYRTSSNGCYACRVPYQDWRIEYTVAPQVTINQTINKTLAYTPDWQNEGMRVLTRRDDLNAYLQTMQLLNNSSIQSPGYSASSGQLVTGTTLYQKGQYSAMASLYGIGLDIQAVNLQNGRLIERLQDGLFQAHQDQTDLVGRLNQGFERVEVIRALGQASQPPVTTQQSTFTSQPAPVTAGVPRLGTGDDAAIAARNRIKAGLQTWWSGQPANCAACHTGAKAEKGFTLDSLYGLDRKGMIDKVWGRVTAADEKVRMPQARSLDGKPIPGHLLTTAERQPLFDYISTMQP